MKGFGLVLRALVTGPARRRPARVVLPVVGVAIGVAAIASIHHANRSVTESFRGAASTVSGRSDFVVRGAGGVGVPLEDLARLSFLWETASFAPAVTGSGIVAREGEKEGDVVDILGVDWGGDDAVRDARLIAPEGASRAELATRGAVLVTGALRRPPQSRPGKRARVDGRRRASPRARRRDPRALRRRARCGRRHPPHGHLHGPGSSGQGGLRGPRGHRARPGRLEGSDAAGDLLRAASRADPRASDARGRHGGSDGPRLPLQPERARVADASRRECSSSRTRCRSRSCAAVPRSPPCGRSGRRAPAIFTAFLVEGAAVGIAGTALGEVLGLFASRAALRAVGGTVSTLYAPTARIEAVDPAGPAALAALVGLSATLVATLLPAAEAMRVAPSPAMRPGAIEGVARRRLGARAVLSGTALLLAALASRAGPIDGFPLFGFLAVVLVVVALALAAPLLVRAGAALPGRILGRALGPSGRLGAGFFGGALAKNGIAVTALAMALGMTLAMIVTVASIRETVRVWVESTLRSDLWIKADAGGRSGIVGDLPPDVIALLEGLDGVDAVDPFRARDAADPEGRPFTLASGDFRVLARAGGLPFVDGRDPRPIAASARERGEVLVSEPFARRFSAADGSTVTLPTPSGPRPFRVAGVYRDYSNDRGTVVMDRELYLSIYRDPRVTSLAVLAEPGVEPAELRRRVLAAAAGRYALTITTNRELRREVLVIFDRTFAVTRALEAIAVAVAVLGIANALMASAVERRRAFGLLRAVGASGEQIRRATLVEALLCGLTGTLAALAAGAAFAWLLLTVINPQSFGWTVALSIPGRTLLGAAALVLLASVLAGIGPGRVAASVDPAAALAEE